jgi:hypothetical protein
MAGHVTESIFSGKNIAVPLADVCFINTWDNGNIEAVMKSSRVDASGGYSPTVYLRGDEGKAFLAAWCRFRYELELDTSKNLEPGT